MTVPTPPWRTARKRAKTQLSQDVIVETGLRILVTDGSEALSMRRVAQALDTGPASLYAHVSNKEELLELIFDRVLGEIHLPEPDPAQWQRQLRGYAMEALRILAQYGDVARIAVANVPTGPNALRVGEWMMGLLVGAGMSPREASFAVDRLALYITADAFEGSQHFARMRAAGVTDPGAYMEEFATRIADYYRTLPADRFPHLTGYVEEMTAGDGDARFEFGLDLLITGMEARLR
ncbi:TetR/AcrR family transcriptional regulator [Nonomuraea longicatena]|uniref:TetR family transcriptional regulator ActII n=1 Tax=Nonomuraea longicatena TaxID=83682 RepID=A0ABN1QMN8_9ACTN